MKKFLAFLGLMALVIGQIAIAQHYVAHPEHGLYEIGQSAQADQPSSEHRDGAAKHKCPECLLAKALQIFLPAAPVIDIAPIELTSVFTTEDTGFALVQTRTSHQPRAPPVFLI